MLGSRLALMTEARRLEMETPFLLLTAAAGALGSVVSVLRPIVEVLETVRSLEGRIDRIESILLNDKITRARTVEDGGADFN